MNRSRAALGFVVLAISASCSTSDLDSMGRSRLALEAPQQQKLFVPSPAKGDRLGSSLAVFGETFLLGSPGDDAGLLDQGSAFVFVRSGSSSTLEAILTAADAGRHDAFGSAVAASCDTALVGAPRAPLGGAVYVHARQGTTWSATQKLVPGDPAAGLAFGTSIAASSDTALVGASSAIYVFSRSVGGYQQTQKLVPTVQPTGLPSLALAQTRLVAGFPCGLPSAGGCRGVAVVYSLSGSTWVEEVTLISSSGHTGDRFGAGVAVESDTVLVGSPGRTVFGRTGQGVTYAMRRVPQGWFEEGELTASDGIAEDAFGSAVALRNGIALIGANGHEHLGQNSGVGAAYTFVRAPGWTEEQELRSSDGQNNDLFGSSVALWGGTLLVGAPNDDGVAQAQGSAYVFQYPGMSETPQCAAGGECSSLFNELGGGRAFTCGIRTDRKLSCFGTNALGETSPPSGNFRALSVGHIYSCALGVNALPACWGFSNTGATSPPALPLRSIAAGFDHSCGIGLDGAVTCWGANAGGESSPPPGAFQAVAVGAWHSCGIRSDGTVACWGLAGPNAQFDVGQATPPSGTFQSIAVWIRESCGVRTDGTIVCWGQNSFGASPPSGTFRSVEIEQGFGCALSSVRKIECWGQSAPTPVPAGQFDSVAIGEGHGCGLRDDGGAACWGRNESGQTTPP